MHNENIHHRHPEAKKIIHWLEKERESQWLWPIFKSIKKSFKMNSMAQANTEVCSLEVSLGFRPCKRPGVGSLVGGRIK